MSSIRELLTYSWTYILLYFTTCHINNNNNNKK